MADVKFSELTTLAAADVASADILAIVDTSASISKKITIDSLFGAVPVNIAVEDTTNAASTTSGSIQTDGGIGVAKSVYVGEKITSANMDFVLGNASATTTTTLRSSAATSAKVLTLPNATDTLVARDTTDTLTNKTLTSPVLNTGVSGTAVLDEDDLNSDSDTQLATQQSIKAYVDSGTVTMTNKTLTSPVLNTGVSGTAILDEDNMASDSATQLATQQSIKAYVDSGTVTMTNKTLTAPVIVDGGFIADANDNEILQFETTTSAVNHVFIQNATTGNKAVIGNVEADTGLTFMNDPTQNEEMLILAPVATAVNEVTIASAVTGSGPSISSTGDDTNVDLLLVAKGTGVVKADGVEVVTLSGTQALSNKTLTAPSVTTSIQASTDSADVVLNQADGVQVARIFDGGATQETGFTAYATGIGGFGFKRNVILADATSAAITPTLVASQSGSIVLCKAGTNNIDFTLPTGSTGYEGIHFEFILFENNGAGTTITFTTAGNDGNDNIHMYLNLAGTMSATVSGDVMTIGNAAPLGTRIRLTLISSGASGAAEVWLAEAFQPSGTALVSVA